MSKDATSDSAGPLLTRDGIAARVAERLKLRKAELTAREKGEAIDRWLDHLKGVIGETMWREVVPVELHAPAPIANRQQPASEYDSPVPNTSPSKPAKLFSVPMAKKGQSLISWARSVLAATDKGLKFEDWLAESKRTLGPNGPHKDPTAFLRFLDTSADRGRLRKRGGAWYSDEMLGPDKPKRTRGAGLKAALMEALVALGGRAEGTAIIQAASSNPLVAEVLSKSRQYPRTMLSRMVIERDLLKEGKEFVLPSKSQSPRELSAEAVPHMKLVGEA